MFGVSVLISDFRRLTSDEIFSQILVAGVGLAWRDFHRFDERDVGRAHVAIHCSVLALVETGDDAEGNLGDHRVDAPMRARGRIRGSGSSAVACASLRYKLSRIKTLMVFGAVLLGCALFAASDEFHQTFVKSRTPSVRDVLLDVAGASSDC